MKYLLPSLCACATVLLLGYLWPLPNPADEANNSEAWSWPSAPQPAIRAAPSKLSTYWPGSAVSNTTESSSAEPSQQHAATHTWRLIGLIRQGQSQRAQVLDPQQQILTLSVGDPLDTQRQVTAIDATRLRWRDATGAAGELLLYPQPTADTHTQSAAQPEPKK